MVEEALLISQLVPCLNAENKVESALTTQELSQVHRRRLRIWKRVIVGTQSFCVVNAACELPSDAVVADIGLWLE